MISNYSNLKSSDTPDGSAPSSLTIVDDFSSNDFCEDVELEKRSNFIDTLDVSHLKNLKMYFFYNDHKEHPLNKNDFVAAICSVTGDADHQLQVSEAEDFFEQVCVEDFNTKEDVILWKQILNEIRRGTTFFQDVWDVLPFDQTSIRMHLMSYCKHEFLVKVISIETEEHFCYAAVSRLGHVGIYDGRLNLLRAYQLHLSRCPDDDTVRTARRRRNVWINDAAYMPDAQFMTVAASDGSVHFVDTVCLVHVPTFCVTGLKTTPTCLEYCPGPSSLLFIGDDKGYITHIEFLQPKRSLFKRDPTNKVDTYLWKDLDAQQEWVLVHTSSIPIHPDTIKRIVYCQEDEATISCCQDNKKSLVIRHIRDKWDPYIFHIQHGVHCFHYNATLKLLVTGCSRTVYIWNPMMTKTYLAKLEGHKKPVVDVRFLEHFDLALSISKDEVLKVWSLNTYACLQTVQFDFPVYNVLGKSVEFSGQTFYPGPIVKQPPEEQQASLKSIDVSNITSVPASIYVAKENWKSELLLVVCSNYVSTIRQNLREYAARDRRSPLSPPPKEAVEKPALLTEWRSLQGGVDHSIGHLSPDSCNYLQESIQTNDDVVNNQLFGRIRLLLDHEAFDLDTLKKPVNGKTMMHVDEMVRNGTPYLAMRLCPVYKLELLGNSMSSASIKSKFSFVEKVDEIFCDGIKYDERPKSRTCSTKNDGREKAINVMSLMETINQLELDKDDDIESIISKYI